MEGLKKVDENDHDVQGSDVEGVENLSEDQDAVTAPSSSSEDWDEDDFYSESYMEEDDGEDDNGSHNTEFNEDPEYERHQFLIFLHLQDVNERYQRSLQQNQHVATGLPPTIPEKLRQFLRLCIQRYVVTWEVMSKSEWIYDSECQVRRKRSFQAMKQFLHNSVETTNNENTELDVINHPMCSCYHEYAVRVNDLEWFRLLVEYGLDISQFDQITLMQLSMGIEDQTLLWKSYYMDRYDFLSCPDDLVMNVDELDFSASNTFSFFLIDTLGIDPYQIHSSVNPEEDRRQTRGRFSLPLYRYLLNTTGYIPIQIKNYREFSLFRSEDEDFGNTTIFNFLKNVIENDLYFNVMCDTTSGTAVPSSSNQVAAAVTVIHSDKRKQVQQRTCWEENVLKQKQSFLSLLVDKFWEESASRIKGVFRCRLDSDHEDFLLFLLDYIDTTGYADWSLQGKHAETVSPARGSRRGNGTTTRRQAALEASEAEEKALETCPRSVLLRKASAGSLKRMTRRLLDLSRNHQQDPIKMQEHQRYVNMAMMEIRSIEMLKYFVEEEHADVNYIDRSSGRTILFNIYDHAKRDKDAMQFIFYLTQRAGFSRIEQRVEGRTILQLAMQSKRIEFVDAWLWMAYGYRTETNFFNPDQRIVFKNIDECLLENGTMNPLTFAVIQYSEPRLPLRVDSDGDESDDDENDSDDDEDDSSDEDVNYFNRNDTKMISHFFKQHQANVNAKDMRGNTAVLYAVQNNCLQLAKQLVSEYGANIYLKNYEGQSAYSLANESLRAKLKKLLTKRKKSQQQVEDKEKEKKRRKQH
jgi:hypothetical protein